MINQTSKQFAPSEQTTARHQRIILTALRNGPVNTISLREQFGIASAAPRIWELRHEMRLPISTRRVKVCDEHGRSHVVAEYTLLTDSKDVPEVD